jgi:hypothetical protein
MSLWRSTIGAASSSAPGDLGQPPRVIFPARESATVSSRNSCSVEGGVAWQTMWTVSPPLLRYACLTPGGTTTVSPADASRHVRPARKLGRPSRTSKRSSIAGWT